MSLVGYTQDKLDDKHDREYDLLSEKSVLSYLGNMDKILIDKLHAYCEYRRTNDESILIKCSDDLYDYRENLWSFGYWGSYWYT